MLYEAVVDRVATNEDEGRLDAVIFVEEEGDNVPFPEGLLDTVDLTVVAAVCVSRLETEAFDVGVAVAVLTTPPPASLRTPRGAAKSHDMPLHSPPVHDAIKTAHKTASKPDFRLIIDS